MKYFLFVMAAAFLFSADISFAQSSQAYSGGNSSVFVPNEGKAAKKNRVKRNKRSFKAAAGRNKAGLFAKKRKSDCDCPGSPKAKRRKRR